MKIQMSEPDGPYSCELDTGVMMVDIREAFIGAKFITDADECLVVSMRDSGFELSYVVNGEARRIVLNEGGFITYEKER